ncbi:asparagine synthase-related protein [Jeotgalibacillus sp. ET6]|uniref:asparagine synthase-related protein n=1 Tax=Jeotgalibacillus sp. ET6 TaxID=3037260 RepID=UPI0024182508|nr:asparagine synthase-related protein [Jeotgalibacillus sp. ET6]MDG5472618.1 asparagine synthase-related protein [Jeotgalibacillus sp. ET6]
MSAIAGVLNFDRHEPVNPEYGKTMMAALAHFPSDDRQVFLKDNVFIGCHAQWVTPESIGEKQPFYDYDLQMVITADAILDNRKELCERLGVKKYDRKQISDCQLILLAYDKWGRDCPKHLIGDFAFMIWDEKKQKAFGARDLSGYRTLYYLKNDSCFVFCTLLKPFFSLPFIDRKLNESWLAEYLAITGMIDTLDAASTPYQSINQVPPSHSIEIENGAVSIQRYGSLYSTEQLNLKSDGEYIEAFTEVFTRAVNDRLRTHRNVGSQLSGGLDSGSVASIAAKKLRQSNKDLYTFSYIPPKDFEDYTKGHMQPNESPSINSTLSFIGGKKHHFLDFEGKDSFSIINEMLEDMEMPYKFFENSFWLQGMFEEASKHDIGILLNGDRGNFTISWGSALDYYGQLLRTLRWPRLYQELNHYSSIMKGKRLGLLPLISKLAYPKMNFYLETRNKPVNHSVINHEFAGRMQIQEKLKTHQFAQTGWLAPGTPSKSRKKLLNDLYPWNYGNTLTAKLSIKHGLWKRDPTNDSRVVQFCLSVPDHQFVQKGMDRALIRRSMKGYLPDDIRLNQRVRGAQGLDWVHRAAPHWNQLVEESKRMLSDQFFTEYVQPAPLQQAFKTLQQGPNVKKGLDPDYRLIMRNLILYRFLKTFN